jgi:adenosylcobinamide amidohydrolase
MTIKSKSFHSVWFEEEVEKFMKENGIKKEEVITITTGVIQTTLWYWG